MGNPCQVLGQLVQQLINWAKSKSNSIITNIIIFFLFHKHRNIIPSLIAPTPYLPIPQTIPKRERSFDQTNLMRIKSAHPLNIDREKLMQENINLKNQLNKLKTEKINTKREINNLENELLQREKIIEKMINESQMNSNAFAKASEMSLVINIKRKYKELKKEYEKNIQTLEQNKQDLKNIKINDLIMENKNLYNQIEKFKKLYYQSEEQKKTIQKNVQDVDVMKQALTKQDDMLMTFQENCQKMEIEIFSLNDQIDKLQTQKEKKEDIYNKLKKKLKIQKQLNEKLVMIKDNIQNTEIFCIMKNEYELKIQNLRKDLAYYRDSNTKNEKLVKEASKFQQKKFEEQKQSEDIISTNSVSRKIQSSNPNPKSEASTITEDEAKEKIILLQNLYMEEKNQVNKLKQTIEELTQKLQNSKMVEPKIILTKSYSANNIKKPTDIIDYAYFSDGDLKEFIYILVKNLEANKIDMSILESRVLNPEILELLKDKKNYREFISQVGNNLIEILKAKNEKDQIDIHSFIKTFLYNNYIAVEKQVPEEFKAKLLSLFTNINFYSLEQRQELNRVIALKLCKIKEKFIELLNYFDEKENGYVTFSTINKIIEQLKIKFKPDEKEYFFYVLKCFPDEGNFLKDLKYENILKILEDNPIDPNEVPDDILAEEEKENNNKKDNDDDAIEITNEEYLSKVRDIISRICEVLKKSKKKIDDYFLKIVSKSINDYRAIRLIKLVDVLKDEFNIELSNIEIFCLFTKVKPNLAISKNTDEDVEEIIDYDKLKEEIENHLKNPPSKKEKKKLIDDEDEKEYEHKKNVKPAVSLSNKPIPKDKLNYSDLLEHAPYENEKNQTNNNFKKVLKDFMKKHDFSFERFVFPVHCMMKLVTDGKKFNRYLDIEFFKHFLYQNGINIKPYDLIEFVQDNRTLYNDDKINIDYLKYIIEGDKYGMGVKESDFILFKQNFKRPEKPDRPEAAKIRQNKKKENKKDDNPFDESDSDSVKMIQKEINGEDYI